MADYVPPTLADFRARFPGFSGFPDEVCQMALDEAILEVQDNWIAHYRFNATLYLTAHLLRTQELGVIDPNDTTSGGGGAPSGGGTTVTGGQLKRRKVGDVEVEWSVASESTSSSGGAGSSFGGGSTAYYFATPYGRRYWELMRRSFPAVRVV